MLLGLLSLAAVAGAAYLWFRRAMAVRLPGDRTGFVAVWALGALLGIVALLQGPGWLGGFAAAIAVLGGSFLTATVAISAQGVAADAVRVGEPLRAFTAPDENGHDFDLASTSGRPVLLKFFRGHW